MANLAEYEQEYYSHVQAAQEKLALAESSGMGGEPGRVACSAAERATEAAKDVVQLMELEGRSLAGPQKTKLQERLRSCRTEVASLKERLKVVKLAARAKTDDRIREEMFAGSQGYSDEEQKTMLGHNERIAKGTDRLNAAHSVTVDMEHTANSILGDLSKQRETLNHARGTLRLATDGLDKSKRLLGQMARRAAMNKATMYFVVALLVGMILLLLWASGGGGGAADAPAASAKATPTTADPSWQKAP